VATADPLIVEVIYALPGRAIVKRIDWAHARPSPMRWRSRPRYVDFAAIDVPDRRRGYFGRAGAEGAGVATGHRIELYRALAADPKNARRERVQRAARKKPALRGANAPRRRALAAQVPEGANKFGRS